MLFVQGHVSKLHAEKRHSNNHRSMQPGIICVEEGIVSIEEKQEWPVKKKRDTQGEPVDQSLIGGIGQQSPWETSYQRQVNGEQTDKSQLSLLKQSGPRRQIPSPYQNTINSSKIDIYSTSMLSTVIEDGATRNSGRSSAASKSILSNLGASLVSRVPDAPHRTKAENQPPFAPIPGEYINARNLFS